MNFYLKLHGSYEMSNLELSNSLDNKQPYVISVPVEIEFNTEPHFKAKIDSNLDLQMPECHCIFIF